MDKLSRTKNATGISFNSSIESSQTFLDDYNNNGLTDIINYNKRSYSVYI